MKDKYIVFNAHMIGASHISKGLQCEDYSASHIDDFSAIAVISDGHGDKNCFRSARGAQIACSTAIDVTRIALSSNEALQEIISSPDRMICEIEKSIIFNWYNHVMDDINQNPISDEELSDLDDVVVTAIKSGTRLTKVYGCTLIMAVFLENFWFGIHVGDGKCVCVYENGLYDQPIPWDEEGCVGNRSTSLCDTRAFEKFRYCYSSDMPVAVFVGSDGVDESFDDNGINKCYFSLASWINGMSEDQYQAKAEELLEKISHGGSGDDVSIACVISKVKEIKKPISTSKQVADKMEELHIALTGAEGRFSELMARKKELSTDMHILQDEIIELKESIEKKRNQLEEMNAEYANVDKNLESMKNQLTPIIKQFEEAKGIKRKVDDYWRQLGVEVYDNETVMRYVPPMEINSSTVSKTDDSELKKTELAHVSEPDNHQVVEEVVSSQGETTNGSQRILRDKQVPVEEYQKGSFLGNIFRKK